METIAKLIDWSVEEIQIVNPIYKKTYIPQASPNQCITGPLPKIGKLVSMEDSLYALERSIYSTINPTQIIKTPDVVDTETDSITTVSNEKVIYHNVKSGETMTKIAAKYGVTNAQILKWNNLRSTRVNVGKRLKIILKSEVQPAEITPKTATTPEFELGTIEYDTVVVINHVVARNESLTVIASKYSVTADQLKKWNNLTSNWLNIGQVLKINATVKLTKQGLVEKTKVVEKIVEKPVEKAPVKKYYTIKSGDLFNRIAQKHGLTQAQLQKLNPGINPGKIKVGQEIRVK
jgi:membrane-bound lytic murein transglycosylase D